MNIPGVPPHSRSDTDNKDTMADLNTSKYLYIFSLVSDNDNIGRVSEYERNRNPEKKRNRNPENKAGGCNLTAV